MFLVKPVEQTEQSKIVELEEKIFSDAWSERSIADTYASKTMKIFGVYQDEKLAGYVIFSQVLDEGEIERIAVDPDFRRCGAGSFLMEWLLDYGKNQGIARILLEVRGDNLPARNMYEKYGFQVDGVRKNYYTAPKDDAVLMSRGILC